MLSSIRKRLTAEQRQLENALERLGGFVVLTDTLGGPPPTVYRLQLGEFGFLVRRGNGSSGSEPSLETYCRERHGPIELVLAANPMTYPYEPWIPQMRTTGDLTVFNPHVAASDRPERGGVCWIERTDEFRPGEWPVARVLFHVVRILSGECIAFEGFALQEEAKYWFAENREGLPFAHVPLVPDLEPALEHRPAATEPSSLGIVFEEVSDDR